MKKQLQTIRNQISKILGIGLLILGVGATSLYAQTVLISPTGDGGFENGSTLAANGWTEINGAVTNKWYVGGASGTVTAGLKAAYISNDAGVSNAYTVGNISNVYFYRDVTFPAGETVIQLSFKWKTNGETTWDYLTVYTSPTSTTPVANSLAPGTSSNWTTIPTVYSGAVVRCTPPNLNLVTTTQTQTLSLPASFAGTTQRLVFMWNNDGSGGTTPPASVDEISLTSRAPASIVSAGSGNWSSASTWVGGIIPTSSDIGVQIASGHTVINDGAALTMNDVTIDGTLSLNGNLTVNGGLTVNSTGILNGFFGTSGKTLTLMGNATNDGSINLNMPGTILSFNGTTAQTFSGAGSFSNNIIPTLTVNNTAGVTFNQNATVAQALNLTNGVLYGSGILTLGNATFNNTFTCASTGGRIDVSTTVLSGLSGLATITYTYGASTPVATYTTGNELSITAPNLNVTFGAATNANYNLGTNITVNNITANDTVDVGTNTMTLNGAMTFTSANTNIIGAGGTFTMGPNATITSINTAGLTASSATGHIRTGTRNYSPTGNYIYNVAAAVTGDGLPATLTGGTVTISAATTLTQNTIFNNLTLTAALTATGMDITINGIGNIGTTGILAANNFTAGASSRLLLGNTNAAGVIQTTAAGNIQSTTKTFTPGVDIVLGTGALATGNGFPISGVDSLVFNATAGVTLTAATTVNTLSIINTGRLTTTATNILTIAGNTPGNVSKTSTGYIDGPLKRTLGVGSTGTYAFPLGVGAVSNLGIDLINPVVTTGNVTLTAVVRSQSTTGTAGTGFSGALNTNRYWGFSAVTGAGALTGIGNIKVYETTVATIGTGKKLGAYAGSNRIGTYNSIGGLIDSSAITVLSSGTVPVFSTGTDSTFFVLGAGISSGTFTAGTFQVGPTGTYSSLTAALAQLSEYTAFSGPVVLELQATYNPTVETYPIVFNGLLPTTSVNTLTIQPSSGVSSPINFTAGTTGSLPLFDFNKGKNIIIDGRAGGIGTDRFIVINQLNNAPAVRYINDAQNVVLRRVSLSANNASTTSGVVFFSTAYAASATNGNNNNTIDFCSINGNATSYNGIYASGTSGGENKNCTISNNNIYDFFNNGGTAVGILVSSNDTGWVITNNNIYQTASRNTTSNPALTSSSTIYGIHINASSSNSGFTVSGNTIGGNIAGIAGSVFNYGDNTIGTGVSIVINGIYLQTVGTTSASSVQGNKVANINLYSSNTSTSNPFQGIYAQTGFVNMGNITPNTVGATSGTGSINITYRGTSTGTCYGMRHAGVAGGMYSNTVGAINLDITGASGSLVFVGLNTGNTYTSAMNIQNNTIGNSSTANSIYGSANAVGAISIYGIQPNSASGLPLNITGNTIANMNNNNGNASSSVRGIMSGTSSSSSLTTISGNTVRNLSNAAPNTATTENSAVVGIGTVTSGAGTQIISGNTISNLTSTITTPIAINVAGIYYSSTTTGTNNTIDKNLIHSLGASNTNTLASLSGITLAGGSTRVGIVNNMIRLGSDASGASFTGTHALTGILKSGGIMSVLHNTVYIDGPGVDANAVNTFAFRRTSAGTGDSLVNNIFVNGRSNAISGGSHYAVGLSNSTTLLSNANIYYTSGTGGVLGLFNTLPAIDISAWRTATGQDVRSQSDDPHFINPTGPAAAMNLRISTAVITLAEATAIPISWVKTDFDGNIRAGNPGYPAQTNGGGTAPDLGASEFDGLPALPALSSIGITPSTTQCATTARVVTVTVVPNQGTTTGATLNYSFDGAAQTPIAMSNTSGNIWEGTIPVATPTNAKVTYSVSATNSAGLSATLNGTSYKDEPLTGVPFSVSANVNPVCAGSPVTLTAKAGNPASLTLGAGALSTTTVTGVVGNRVSPFYHYYGGIRNQFMIRASELVAMGIQAGPIVSLGIDVAAAGITYNGFSLSMAATASTDLASSLVTTGLSTVYSAASVTPTVGVNTYTFTTPFNWDGVSNVVMQFCWTNNNGGSTTATIKYDNTSFVSQRSIEEDNSTTICSGTGTVSNQNSARPKMILGFVPVAISSYSWSDGSTVVGTTNPITVAPTTNTSYTVTATDPAGCTISNTASPLNIVTNSTTLASGSYNVGVGMPYTSLTQAVADYNNACTFTGPIEFVLTDAVYDASTEVFPIVIKSNSQASAVNTLKIKPATGVSPLIQGKNASAIIQLKGAKYVTIDGSNNGTSTTDLTIANDSNASLGSAVWITSRDTFNTGASFNTIKNCKINGFSSATTIAGILSGSYAAFGNDAEFPNNNNTIQNNVITKVQNGMYLRGGATTFDSGWVVSQNTMGSQNVVADKLGFRGMLIGNSRNFSISNNTIVGVASSTTSTSTTMGIQVALSDSFGVIKANKIGDIKQNNTTGYAAVGLYLGSAYATSNITAVNNVVYDIAGRGSATLDNNAAGIVAATGGGYNIYFNSVNMTSTQTTGSTTALYVTGLITTPNSLNIRNNIFVNNSLANHTRYAVYSGATNAVYTDINYNDYFTTGTALSYLGSARTALADWKTATGKDANSISNNPIFATTSLLIPDLSSLVLGTGTSIPGFGTDIIDTLRANPPSMGAYEKGIDVTGPAITYTALTNTTNIVSSALSNVGIVDASLVNTTPGSAPRVYYKKKSETNVFGSYPSDNNAAFNGWKYQEATGTTSPFNFTLDYSLLTASALAGDTIQYFVTAQDMTVSHSVSSNPSIGFAATDVNTITAAPTTPNYFVIIGTPMSGTYNVGAGLTAPTGYPTISAAITDASLRGLGGAVRFELMDANYSTAETFPIVINPIIGSTTSNTITIAPATGVTATITGSSATGIFRLNGADNIIIDGSNNGTNTKDLTISNTNTAAGSSGILLASEGPLLGCENDTIRNVNILAGSNTVLTRGISVTGDNNKKLAFIGNSIKKAQLGIDVVVSNVPAGLHSGIYIAKNSIGDVLTTNNIGKTGIKLSGAPATIITQNIIFNTGDNSTGDNSAIEINSNCSKTEISSNRIDTVFNGNTGGYAASGIDVLGSDSLLIVNNSISRMAIYNYSTTSLADNPFGIRIGSGSGHKIYFNSVNLFGNSLTGGTTGTLSAALAISGGSNYDVRNNILSNSYVGLTGSNSYAIYSSVASPFAIIDNNNYYGSGTYGKLGYLGSNRNTLADWKSATTKDASSSAANPGFVANSDLNIGLGSTPTPLESGAATIAGINTDINGNIRPNTTPTTYGGNLAADMGAFEFDGAPVDLSAPVIMYTALTNGNSAVNRLVSINIVDNGATATGVNTVSGTAPRFYYKKKRDGDQFLIGNSSLDSGWKWVEASNATSPFNFTIDYSKVLGGSVTNSDTIRYFVVAQDNALTPNISSNPLAGFAGTLVSNITAAPTTPNEFIVVLDPPMSGVYQIGSGQVAPNFTTITAALSALTLKGASGPVTFVLADPSYTTSETYPLTINSYVGASSINNLNIKPAASQSTSITAGVANGVFVINCPYVTIDGSNSSSASRDLTITNTNTGTVAGAIRVLVAGHNVVVKNTILKSNSSADGFGVLCNGDTGAVITNNEIGRSVYGIQATAGSNGIVISKNMIGSQSLSDKIQNTGIDIVAIDRYTIDSNYIYGITRATTEAAAGISVTGASTNGIITKNTITDISHTGTNFAAYGAFGIVLDNFGSNTVNGLMISNNMISNIIADGDDAPDNNGTTWVPQGIYLRGGSNLSIYNNTVHLSGLVGGVGLGANQVRSGALTVIAGVTNLNVRNNIFIDSLTFNGVANCNSYAIVCGATNSAFTNIDYNNYFISGVNGILGYLGADITTLAGLKAATAKDLHSVNVSVSFISLNNLHLTGTSLGNFNLAGTSISGLTKDIDGDTRHTTYPYMGADESATNPLPVTLASFTGKVKDADAILSWTTVSEINNKGFEIERSTDGRNFEKVNFVEGAGNSTKAISYNLVDAKAFAISQSKVLYYRLKQIDFDGKYAYSQIVRITLTAEVANALSVYPNPFTTSYEVGFTATEGGNGTIEMLDIQGKAVATQHITFVTGLNTIPMSSVVDLNSGVYFVKLHINGETQVLKLVKN